VSEQLVLTAGDGVHTVEWGNQDSLIFDGSAKCLNVTKHN